MKTIRTFDRSSEEPGWAAQNDGVMGGVSSGKAEIEDDELHFSGVLSLENNGGFAQIYSQTDVSDFSNYSAVKLRVKGDGRTYQFRMATDARFRGSRIAYRAEFKTEADEWIEVSIPFESFVPSFRGRILSEPPLDLKAVREIALLLGDGTPGAFSLKVDWIGLE
jgi:NADH dehydrogenase [ubiquinone] 1 alpha subcomplex assembly factor 1